MFTSVNRAILQEIDLTFPLLVCIPVSILVILISATET